MRAAGTIIQQAWEGVMSLFLSVMVIGISLPDGQNATGRIRWGALSSALPRQSAGSDFPR